MKCYLALSGGHFVSTILNPLVPYCEISRIARLFLVCHTSGGRLVGIVRSRTQTMEFSFRNANLTLSTQPDNVEH
jgi:hypothetical protein